MKNILPNIITFTRTIGAITLLLTDVSTDWMSSFWIIYLLCGITDMADGFIARKLNTTSKFGAMLDSVADLCFAVCCAWKIFPLLILDTWMWIWIVLIGFIKIINQVSALVCCGKIVFPHTIANKITGLLIFISIPIYLCFSSEYPIFITAFIATFAAIQEGHYIRKNSNKNV